MNSALVVLAGVLITASAVPAMNGLVRMWRLKRPNFRGDEIPAGYGLLLVLAAVPVYTGLLIVSPDVRAVTFLAAVLVFGAVGLLDDLYGTRSVGGFGGHFGLLGRGELSTGVVKAGVGGIAGLVLGIIVAGGRIGPGILNALLIVFWANTLNLLDLRPGRAVSCFWVGACLLVLGKLGRLSVWPEVLVIVPAALWLTALDRSARVMLGDAGSNPLGAALGLALAWEASLTAKIVLVVLLAGVQIYAEKYSISKLIEGNRVLRAIDSRLGVR